MREPRVVNRIFQCCAWNGVVFWFSLPLFYWVLISMLPSVTAQIIGDPSLQRCLVMAGLLPHITFQGSLCAPHLCFAKLWMPFEFKIQRMWHSRCQGRRLSHTQGQQILDLRQALPHPGCFESLPVHLASPLFNLLHMSLLHSLHCLEYHWFNKGTETYHRLSNREDVAFLLWIWFAHGLPKAVSPPTLPVAASSLFVHRQFSEAKSPTARPFSCCASSPWWFSSAEDSSTGTLPAVCPEELSLCRKFPSLHVSPAM